MEKWSERSGIRKLLPIEFEMRDLLSLWIVVLISAPELRTYTANVCNKKEKGREGGSREEEGEAYFMSFTCKRTDSS
jgi:hypothetical protein